MDGARYNGLYSWLATTDFPFTSTICEPDSPDLYILELHLFVCHWPEIWQLALVKCKWAALTMIIFLIMYTEEGDSYLVVCLHLDNHQPCPYSGDKNYQKGI